LNQRYVVLNDSYQNLQRNEAVAQASQASALTEISRALSESAQESKTLPAKVESRVAQQIAAENQRLSAFKQQLSALKATVDSVSRNQQDVAGSQADTAKQISELTKTVAAQSAQIGDVSKELWRVGDTVLRPQVNRVATEMKASLEKEWSQEVREVRNRAEEEKRNPSSFTENTVKLSHPEIRAYIQDGVVYIEGSVPTEEKKAEIEKAFSELRPKRIENRLAVNPW
jgi:hypothetical protein